MDVKRRFADDFLDAAGAHEPPPLRRKIDARPTRLGPPLTKDARRLCLGLDLEIADQVGPVEQDCFPGHPVQSGAAPHLQPHGHPRWRADGAVDLLASLAHHAAPRLLAELDIPGALVSARHPTCGVDEDGVGRTYEAHLGGALLEQALKLPIPRDSQPSHALGPLRTPPSDRTGDFRMAA